jgi:hypothetical protein
MTVSATAACCPFSSQEKMMIPPYSTALWLDLQEEDDEWEEEEDWDEDEDWEDDNELDEDEDEDEE